ncbi:MAG: hypothetical protein FWD68_14460 [Alphaproteobacteria bacterium]|nr:hypothetical protein [Alphaproteobacteria bacterium]
MTPIADRVEISDHAAMSSESAYIGYWSFDRGPGTGVVTVSGAARGTMQRISMSATSLMAR